MAEDISSSMSSVSKDELGLDGLPRTATGDDEDMCSVLAEVGLKVEIGHDTLLAEVSEQSPEAIDTAMARLGGTVLRRQARGWRPSWPRLSTLSARPSPRPARSCSTPVTRCTGQP
jgi:hypothetical protein